MAKLTIWQDQHLKENIEQCIHGYKPKYRRGSILTFPLEDILFDFYKGAVYSRDFHGLEALHALYDEYCQEVRQLDMSLEDMVDQGYISVYMGRWDTTLLHSSIFEKENLTEYPQGEVLRFLLWLEEHPEGKKSCMEIVDPEQSLGKWRAVCADVPNADWFVQKSYLEEIDGKYYAVNGYGWDRNVDRALAKLWEYWGPERFETWLSGARCVNGTSCIFEFLGTESGKELLHMMVQQVLNKYEVPTLEARNRCYKMTHVLSSPSYAKKPEEYKESSLWKGNRVLDIYSYGRYGFEEEQWYGTHAEDFQLVLYSVMEHMDLLKAETDDALAGCLRQYDWLGATHGCYGMNSESLYELLTNGELFFMGVRHLVCADRGDRRESQGQAERVCAVLRELISSGVKCQGFLNGEEVGSCLLYLFHEYKMTGRNGKNLYYLSILKAFVKALGTRECLEEVGKGLLEYASSLLSMKNSVDWCTGFHLILFCAEEWFFKNDKLRTLELAGQWMELIWNGCQKIFSGQLDYATYISEKYFTESVCAEIFKRYIEPEKRVEQRNRLFPASMKGEADKQRALRYRYRLLLHILYMMYTAVPSAPSVVKTCIVDVLEEALLGKEKIFDYTYVQIFSSEEVLNSCLGILSSKEKDDSALMDELIKEPIPDLLIYYHAVKDSVLKERLHKAIAERAAEDSLDVFHGTRAIELVLEYKLEALYPAAEKELAHWLETWKKRGVSEQADYVEHAKALGWWLKYNQGKYLEVLSGDNRFYQAIIYMDVEEFFDLKRAGTIWQEMIERQGSKKYGGGVYLNYLLVLARRMEHWQELGSAERDELNERFQWLTNRIEECEISDWDREKKEAYCRIVIECKRRRGEAFLHEIYDYNQKYDISFNIEQFLADEASEKVATDETTGHLDEQELSGKMADALCRFHTMNLEQKGKAYYESRAFTEVQEAQQTLVVESVLKTCDVLQRYGAQLVQKKDGRSVLGEDLVTQLFCELYNAAYSSWFHLNASNQRQMGTTGNWRGERKSPAELDIVIGCEDQILSIAEAFVLKEDTKREEFRDHVGKAIGNNVGYAPLGFMLLYGNAVDNDKAWNRYCKYLDEKLKDDLVALKSQNVWITVLEEGLEEASYYASDVFRQYHGLRFVRQVIMLGAEKYELLHIFIDVAKNAHSVIRKGL